MRVGSERAKSARRALVLLAIAIVALLLGHHTIVGLLVVVAIAQLLVALAVPRLAAAIDRFSARVADAVGAVLGVAFWALVVVPLWAVQRVLRFDAIGPASDGWEFVPLTASVRTRAARLFGGEGRGGVVRRLHAFAVTAVALAVVAGVLAVGSAIRPTSKPDTSKVIGWCCYHTYSHEHEPFAQELFNEQRIDESKGTQVPIVEVRVGAANGTYFHVSGGIRRSYEPASPQLTVWFFGGSTMLGIGQRDEHTIPSEVARLAEQDHLRLNVVNYGSYGWVNYQEVELFGVLLSHNKRADLAVFYDGCNDGALAGQRIQQGDPNLHEPIFFTPDLLGPNLPNVFDRKPRQQYPAKDQEALSVAVGADQYGAGVGLAQRLGKGYGVDTAFAWQPTMATKAWSPADHWLLDALGWSSPGFVRPKAMGMAIPDRAGVHPFDLTKALDNVKDPVFSDTCHTNELGAHVIAARLYEQLKPQLVALADRTSSGH